jgi:2-haloacid dehalogenase
MKDYNYFLFDADGTLFDYDKAEENALHRMLSLYNYDYSETLLSKYKKINSDAWQSYERGEISKESMQTIRFSRLFELMSVDWDATEFNKKYLFELGKGRFLIDGAFELCKELYENNKTLYIITNGILLSQKTRIEHSSLKPYISKLFVSEEIGYSKPNIEYFKYVLSNIECENKSNILVIGDLLETDIAGANNAGIDSCWINTKGISNDTKFYPTYEVTKLSEIQDFLSLTV